MVVLPKPAAIKGLGSGTEEMKQRKYDARFQNVKRDVESLSPVS